MLPTYSTVNSTILLVSPDARGILFTPCCLEAAIHGRGYAARFRQHLVPDSGTKIWYQNLAPVTKGPSK